MSQPFPRVQLRVPRSGRAGGQRSRSGSTRGEGAAVAGNQLGRALHPPLGRTGGKLLARSFRRCRRSTSGEQGLPSAARPLSFRRLPCAGPARRPASAQARAGPVAGHTTTMSSAAAPTRVRSVCCLRSWFLVSEAAARIWLPGSAQLRPSGRPGTARCRRVTCSSHVALAWICPSAASLTRWVPRRFAVAAD